MRLCRAGPKGHPPLSGPLPCVDLSMKKRWTGDRNGQQDPFVHMSGSLSVSKKIPRWQKKGLSSKNGTQIKSIANTVSKGDRIKMTSRKQIFYLVSMIP